MQVQDLVTLVKTAPNTVEFSQVMDVIKNNYQYTPTAFTNGNLTSEAGSNEGSCKIFYFAQLNKLSVQETLSLFGTYYREDVLQHPKGTDHGNIRNFMLTGWDSVKFTQKVLVIN
jgi:hypothetical protein